MNKKGVNANSTGEANTKIGIKIIIPINRMTL